MLLAPGDAGAAARGARPAAARAARESIVGSVARKGMWGRLWVRDLLSKLISDGMIDLGFAPEDYLGLTDLQVAAVGWLAQQALFARLAAEGPAGCDAGMESETSWRARRSDHGACRRFGIALDEASVEAIVAGPGFSRHSKHGRHSARRARRRAARSGEAPHRDEIDKVTDWAESGRRPTPGVGGGGGGA